MVRRALFIALFAAATVPMTAQTPAGWKVRLDSAAAPVALDAAAGLKVAPTEKGFHLTSGPAAILWDPSHTVKPIYRVKATFTQLKKADTNAYYGLFFGGNGLDGASPEYV